MLNSGRSKAVTYINCRLKSAYSRSVNYFPTPKNSCPMSGIKLISAQPEWILLGREGGGGERK